MSGKSARRAGFTLIELLVVMTVIALLLSIALPRYFNHLEASRVTILQQDLAVMRDALDKFHGDNGRYPDSLKELVDARYIRSVPVDPLTESADTWVEQPPPDGESSGVYDVKSGAPGTTPDGRAYGDL